MLQEQTSSTGFATGSAFLSAGSSRSSWSGCSRGTSCRFECLASSPVQFLENHGKQGKANCEMLDISTGTFRIMRMLRNCTAHCALREDLPGKRIMRNLKTWHVTIARVSTSFSRCFLNCSLELSIKIEADEPPFDFKLSGSLSCGEGTN